MQKKKIGCDSLSCPGVHLQATSSTGCDDILIERLSLDIEPEDVAEDSPLFGAGLGLDSVDALEIAIAIETEFECEVTDENMQVFRSVNTVVDFILANKSNSDREDA